jgi:hypothetical protein
MYLAVRFSTLRQSHLFMKGKAIPLQAQILRQSAHEGGKVVSPTHRPSLPPGNIPGTHFC